MDAMEREELVEWCLLLNGNYNRAYFERMNEERLTREYERLLGKVRTDIENK